MFRSWRRRTRPIRPGPDARDRSRTRVRGLDGRLAELRVVVLVAGREDVSASPARRRSRLGRLGTVRRMRRETVPESRMSGTVQKRKPDGLQVIIYRVPFRADAITNTIDELVKKKSKNLALFAVRRTTV